MALPNGVQINLPFFGRYEIENATLAIEAGHILCQRLRGSIPADYFEKASVALEAAVWPGRCEKLADSPAIFIDGAVNPLSLRVYLESIEARITSPVVAVAAVPSDRNIAATYAMLAERADHLILTASPRNITIGFPDERAGIEAAKLALADVGRQIPVEYAPSIAEAIQRARIAAGAHGTIVMAVAQPAIGDAMEYFGRSFEQI